MTYRLLSVARIELAEAAKYYAAQSRGLGFEFMDEFDAVVERIMRLPEGWKRVGTRHRRCPVSAFPIRRALLSTTFRDHGLRSDFPEARSRENQSTNPKYMTASQVLDLTAAPRSVGECGGPGEASGHHRRWENNHAYHKEGREVQGLSWRHRWMGQKVSQSSFRRVRLFAIGAMKLACVEKLGASAGHGLHLVRRALLAAAACASMHCACCWGEGREAEIQARLDEAIRGGAREVVLPSGTVRLGAPIRIRDARDLEIRGEGTTLVLGFTGGTAIQVYACSNLALRGFTLDSDPLPFTQGTVISKDAGARTCEFRVHDGYPSLTEDYLITHIHLFEAKRARWKESAPDIYARRVVALDPRRGRIEFGGRAEDFEAVAIGDRIVLNKRDGGGIRMDRCEDVRVEGLTFLSAPGGAVLARYMRGNNRFTYDVRPGPPPRGASEPRLMSTCADAFNYAYARRGPVLEKCRFSFMGDDSVNLHGFTLLVLRAIGQNELLVGWPYARESAEWVVAPGDTARWLRVGNYAVAGEAPVESFVWEPKPDPELQARIDAFWARTAKGRGAVFRLKVARPLGAPEGDVIDLPGSSAPEFRIADCEFADHRARGARIMAQRGIIEDCVFLRTKQAAITLGPEYVFWRESGWVQDVAIRGNRIEDCGLSPDMTRASACTLGAISIFARKEDAKSTQPFAADNRRLTIENNTIRGCAVAAIWVRCANDLAIRNNTISRVNLSEAIGAGADAGFDVRGPIDARGVGNARVEGNRVE